MLSRKWLLISLLLVIVVQAAAQNTCSALVREALSSLDSNCELTERNQACYGNISLSAKPRDNVSHFKFDTIGDIANLDDIETLDLEPMDTASGTWGVAMMKVQADIPDTLPGQNVTFLLFGDVTIENKAVETQTPMQAFYLTTGIGDSKCAEAPESGLMVQTPNGVKEVVFNINGVDVQMGSTVVFQAEAGKEMRVKTLEGKARLKVKNKVVTVVQGSQYTVPIDENFNVTQPGDVSGYETSVITLLPMTSLAITRAIDIAKPLTQQQIQEVKHLEEAGAPVCSDAPGTYLPPCTKPLFNANGEELEFYDSNHPVLFDATGKPVLYDEEGEPITSMEDYEEFIEYWADPVLPDDFGVDGPSAETAVESVPTEEVPVGIGTEDVKPPQDDSAPVPTPVPPTDEPAFVDQPTNAEVPTTAPPPRETEAVPPTAEESGGDEPVYETPTETSAVEETPVSQDPPSESPTEAPPSEAPCNCEVTDPPPPSADTPPPAAPTEAPPAEGGGEG